jgi:hypothetical protein
LNDALTGLHELARSAPNNTRQWQNLAAQFGEKKVVAVSGEKSLEQEQLADANSVVEDMRRLRAQITSSKLDLARAKRDGIMPADVADDELKRLTELEAKITDSEKKALAVADGAADAVGKQASGGIRPLIQADIAEARRLDKAAQSLSAKLTAAGDELAQGAVEKLYNDVRRVLDKAKLGKIDAIIGQKRKLDIEVQDLAAGRFPEELIGKLWNASMIADDEEYWPWQGEYWADEYEGWR